MIASGRALTLALLGLWAVVAGAPAPVQAQVTRVQIAGGKAMPLST